MNSSVYTVKRKFLDKLHKTNSLIIMFSESGNMAAHTVLSFVKQPVLESENDCNNLLTQKVIYHSCLVLQFILQEKSQLKKLQQNNQNFKVKEVALETKQLISLSSYNHGWGK